MLLVEDPFDDTDNVARTLGTWDDPPLGLAFVSQVFESTAEVLDGMSAGAVSMDVALAWLFGPRLMEEVPSLCPDFFSPVSLLSWMEDLEPTDIFN